MGQVTAIEAIETPFYDYIFYSDFNSYHGLQESFKEGRKNIQTDLANEQSHQRM